MNCEEARERWHVRFDEEIEDAKLSGHLDSCGACRQYAAQMDRLAGVLDDLRQETETIVSAPARPATSEQPRGPARTGLRFTWRLTRIAAAVAILVAGTSYFWSHRATLRPVVSPGESAPPDPRIGISLRGETAQRFMAVTKPTSEPEVQLYWLYPKIEPDRSEDRS